MSRSVVDIAYRAAAWVMLLGILYLIHDTGINVAAQIAILGMASHGFEVFLRNAVAILKK